MDIRMEKKIRRTIRKMSALLLCILLCIPLTGCNSTELAKEFDEDEDVE